MSSARKRVVLTLKEKSEIVEALDRGETYRSLCDKYGIGKATIYDIKRKGEIIQAYSRKVNEEVGTSKRKVMKPSKLEEVEQALYNKSGSCKIAQLGILFLVPCCAKKRSVLPLR
uniref:HTH psq-type domain-containing protein n=1 Tax=Trichuris muris TaxID=70415 RepID=A0A5S6QV06_TRIMR